APHPLLIYFNMLMAGKVSNTPATLINEMADRFIGPLIVINLYGACIDRGVGPIVKNKGSPLCNNVLVMVIRSGFHGYRRQYAIYACFQQRFYIGFLLFIRIIRLAYNYIIAGIIGYLFNASYDGRKKVSVGGRNNNANGVGPAFAQGRCHIIGLVVEFFSNPQNGLFCRIANAGMVF